MSVKVVVRGIAQIHVRKIVQTDVDMDVKGAVHSYVQQTV